MKIVQAGFEVMVPLLEEVKRQIPVVFDDLVTE